MGALTDNRKRCFVDLCLPSSAPHPSLETPSKKSKLLPPPPSPEPPAAPKESPPAAGIRRLPPAAPLPRPVHAPQRVLKAFQLGSRIPGSTSRHKPEAEMGNYVSRVIDRKRVRESSARTSRPLRPDDDADRIHERLDLDEYKKLVLGVQEGHSAVSGQQQHPRSFASGASDLTVVTRKEEERSSAGLVVNKKVENARKAVLESTPLREDRVWVKKGPLYKELLEDSTKRDRRLRGLEFELKLTEQKISGFRLVHEVLKRPKGDLHELFAPLTDEEEDEIYYALCGGSSRELLVTHEPSNIEITREVLQCLNCGAWLNDEVINLYLELLKERERREPKRFLKCHFFNTFFYKKLIGARGGYDFKAVKRWTTQKKIGYGLIECDKIFVPIHKEIHWCLAVIDVKDERFMYLDSLGGMDDYVLKILARYLMDEVKDKSGKEIDTTSWKREQVEDLPLQRNGWDCGMFMLKYTDFYSRGSSLSFEQENMEYFRKRTAKEILKLRAD